jgi:predicted O-methyltransferase YrrM
MFRVTDSQELPGVLAAYERADSAGFQLACEADVGRLLAALAAAVPAGGRVLEIGTGVGVGLAWMVHGLGARRDVEVVTVELDDEVQRTARSAPWPPWVRFEPGDGAEIVGRLGQFDLIFPDAPGGKIFKLRRSVAALRRGGVLVVDDMDLTGTTMNSSGLPWPWCVTVCSAMRNSSAPNWASAAASSWPSSAGRDLRGCAPKARSGSVRLTTPTGGTGARSAGSCASGNATHLGTRHRAGRLNLHEYTRDPALPLSAHAADRVGGMAASGALIADISTPGSSLTADV